jgi:hypothetical protein
MIFPLASVSRPALGPTQLPVQWVPWVFSPGVKARPGRDADHSPPSVAEVENEYELYLLSPQAPPWRVAGLLYLLLGSPWSLVCGQCQLFRTDRNLAGSTNCNTPLSGPFMYHKLLCCVLNYVLTN